MIDLNDPDACHRFDHEAMNTVFSIRTPHQDRARASDAALACFERLDNLEDALSRYRDGSDVCQINAMRAGESLLIREDTHRCLLQAFDAHRETGGLFDITLGRQIEHLKTQAEGPPPPCGGQLSLSPDRPVVQCLEPGRSIDLGGIGKGYALERMGEVLREWAIESALLCSGASTMLAIGQDAWPIELTGVHETRRLTLKRASLSASGTAVQGVHLVHPAGPHHVGEPRRHTWIESIDAALADAYSTAAALMNEADLRRFAENAAAVNRVVLEQGDGRLVELWPSD